MDPFETFSKSIEPFMQDWRSIEIRVIAQHALGGWIFDAVRIILDSEPSRPVRNDLPTVPHLLAASEYWEVSRFTELIGTVRRGELPIQGEKVIIKRLNGESMQAASPSQSEYKTRDYCRSDYGIDFACYEVGIWQSLTPNYAQLQEIEASVRSHNPPWDGLPDLREHFIGIRPDRARQRDAQTLNIIAPLRVRLSGSLLTGDTLTTKVERDRNTSLNDIHLSTISRMAEDNISRIHHPLKVTTNNDPELLTQTLKLSSAPSKVKLIAIYRGLDVDQNELFGKPSPLLSPRASILGTLGGGIEEIREFMKEKHNFEKGVTLLLHLLGFSPANYGSTSWEGPDIIAFSDRENFLLVVECTHTAPDWKNKLTKLATRTKDIQRSLVGFEVLPVLITSRERSMINLTDSDKASKERIAVVTADEIPRLFSMAIEGGTPDTVREYLQTLIPYIQEGY